MTYLELKTKLKDFPVFSTSDIRNFDPNFHRRRLDEWQKKGYIKMIKRGYYVFTDISLDDHLLFLIANKIYTPSYISLETALSYYQLIPESVYSITSVSSAKTVKFDSPVAHFSYRHLKPELLFGTSFIASHQQQVLLGDPEKALLDYLYLNPGVNSPEKIAALRLNRDLLSHHCDWAKIASYLDRFSSHALTNRVNILRSYLK